MMKARLVLALPIAMLLAAGSIPQSQGSMVTVTRKTTKLRSAKKLYATPVADLVEGDKLAMQAKEGAWLAVKWKDVSGFIHVTDVSEKPDVRLSGEGVSETYSASETSAARKGFNPQVEKQYRDQNPDLETAFKKVDQIQAGKVDDAAVKAFLIQGKLITEGGK